LKGFLAVDSETGSSAGKVAPGYGKMRLLQLPQGSSVAGPGQVENTFVSDSNVKTQIRLLQDQGTKVVYGNLLTLPVGGGLLYVQPLYVQATSGTQFPSLQKVVVGFGEEVGVADTLDEALNAVFGGDSGAAAGDKDVEKEPEVNPPDGSAQDPSDGEDGSDASASPAPSESSSPPESAEPAGDLATAVDAALKAFDDADAAMKAGDWDAFAKAQKDLQAAREAMRAARQDG
jgi:uncharacterized membrane protein (UPF0182 family)